MFFETFSELCSRNNISTYKVCTQIGLNRSAVNKWKAGGTPNASTLTELARYFDVTVDFLLGKTHENADPSNDLQLSKSMAEHLKKYSMLNEMGQKKVNEYIDDLIMSNKYTDSGRELTMPLAARKGKPVTEEGVAFAKEAIRKYTQSLKDDE